MICLILNMAWGTKGYFDYQARRVAHFGGDPSVTTLDCGLDNGETKADSTGILVASRISPEKRLEYFVEHFFRDRGSVILNREKDGRIPILCRHPNRPGFACIFNGVANEVVDGS